MPGQLLALAQLQWRAGLQRPALAVRQADEAGLRHGQRVAAGGQFGQLEDAFVVGERRPAARQLRGVHQGARALDGTAVVGREDASGNPAHRRRRIVLLRGLRRRVAGRLLDGPGRDVWAESAAGEREAEQ